MLSIAPSSRFKKDYKRCKKRGLNMDLLEAAVKILAIQEPLPEQYLDHPLSGEWIPARECHIAPDWLLVYDQTDTTLYLLRTGTHADLFGM